MKKNVLVLASLLVAVVLQSQAQEKKLYAEFGMGAGQTLFFGNTKQKLGQALGGTFDPGIVGNGMIAFYYAPQSWKGLSIGLRMKGSGAASAKGDNGDSYFFNYYNLGVSAKYYPFQKFNKGVYARVAIGTGQLTTKRADEQENSFTHQFAIGSTLTGGIGYSFPVNKAGSAISLETEFESSNRNGTVDGVGEQSFQSGQIGINLIYSF